MYNHTTPAHHIKAGLRSIMEATTLHQFLKEKVREWLRNEVNGRTLGTRRVERQVCQVEGTVWADSNFMFVR